MRALHWFRSDLRLRDNVALAAAARADELVPVFVFDERLLAGARAGAPRVRFLLGCVARLTEQLAARGQRLVVRRGDPLVEIPRLLDESGAERLTFNRDYGPYARWRDARVRAAAERAGVAVGDCKDRVVFESAEIRTGSGGPYRVYTPYRKAWLARWREDPQEPLASLRLPGPVRGLRAGAPPSPEALGVGEDATELPTPGEAAARRRLRRFLESGVRDYARRRDLPAVDGTSRLSPYLRLGTISIRTCVQEALACAREERAAAPGVRAWLDELIWREFYQAILAEFPHVLVRSFRPEFDRVRWNDDEEGFRAWCAGRTGYPFVDAAMRQLAASGWMHNRARMVVASFLAKDLLVDWRRGEGHFMQRLVDGDPAANNGGWQWAASTGTDAQPYFRIFNPVAQGERFDPRGEYVRRHVPELGAMEERFVHRPWDAPTPPKNYPPRVVDHAERRLLALQRYEAARGGGARR